MDLGRTSIRIVFTARCPLGAPFNGVVRLDGSRLISGLLRCRWRHHVIQAFDDLLQWNRSHD